MREDNTYKYKLFVSYEPFFDYDESLQSKCQLEEFFFESSLEKTGYVNGLMQHMVSCYGRPAVVNPDVSYKDYDYYEEIKIFPASEDSVYVFKYDSYSLDYYLLERYTQIYWENDSIAVPPILLILPPPQTVKWNEPKFLLDLLKMNLLTMRYVFICNLIFFYGLH